MLYGIKLITAGIQSVVIGGALGTLAFGGALYALGIEREDREFFGQLLNRS